MKKLCLLCCMLIIASFLFACNNTGDTADPPNIDSTVKNTDETETSLVTDCPETESNDLIVDPGPSGTPALEFIYSSFDIPENLFISSNSGLTEKYPVYITKYAFGHFGPLYENSEENSNLAKKNLTDFLALLYSENELESFDIVGSTYSDQNLEFSDKFSTKTDIGTIDSAAERVGVHLEAPVVFSGEIEEFIEGNEIINAMMKFAEISDPVIFTTTRHSEDGDIIQYRITGPVKPLTEMNYFEGITSIDFHVYKGEVKGYGLNIRTTDGILGEYETIPYNIALKAVTDAYPEVDTDSVKAYVYYDVGFYNDEEATNVQKLSGCLFPCYRFIVPGVDKDGNDAYAFVDVAMTTFEAMTQ